jgi:hypothetical protein
LIGYKLERSAQLDFSKNCGSLFDLLHSCKGFMAVVKLNAHMAREAVGFLFPKGIFLYVNLKKFLFPSFSRACRSNKYIFTLHSTILDFLGFYPHNCYSDLAVNLKSCEWRAFLNL